MAIRNRTRAILADLLATVRRVKPTFFNGVPTLYIAMLNHPLVQQGKNRLQVDSHLLLPARAPLLGRHQDAISKRWTGARIVEGYSLTEAMMGLCVKPGEGDKQARLGRHAPAPTSR